MRFHSSAIFLSETRRFIPEYTRVFVLFPLVPWAFSHFPQYLTQKFDTRFSLCVDLCCRCRSPTPSRPRDIFLLFFYYFTLSHLFRFRLPLLFSSPSPSAWMVKKIARPARRSAFTLSIELLSDPLYISELLRAWGR